MPTLLVIGVAALACAPATQWVALDATPAPVLVFVDGEAVAGAPPPAIELRADRPHVLFFKRDGYRPERVVLRSVRDEGAPRLEPGAVRVVLTPDARTGGQVEIEFE